jgi:hypothetical protein
LIADVTLKLHVHPQVRRTLLAHVAGFRQSVDLGLRCLQSAYVASGIGLYKGRTLPGLPENGLALAYTAEGLAADVAAELELVQKSMQAAGVTPVEASGPISSVDLWAAHLSDPGEAFQLRTGAPVKDLPAYFDSIADYVDDCSLFCDIASGLVYVSKAPGDYERARDLLEGIRERALALEGYAILLQAPEEWGERLDKWGYLPDTLAIMESLKGLWDPQQVLGSFSASASSNSYWSNSSISFTTRNRPIG